MRECQQCGEANQANSRFCVVCGTPLAVAAGSAAGPLAPAVAPPPFAPMAPVAVPIEGLSPVIAATPPSAAVPAYAPGTPGGSGRPNPNLASTAGRELGAEPPLDAPRTLVGFLVSYETVELGQYWSIHQGRNVVGRQGAATGLDIEISHPTTSSLHAVLLATARPARVIVEDTGSTNGTFVNDNLLAAGQRWELRDGDRIRFGLFNATIKIVQKT